MTERERYLILVDAVEHAIDGNGQVDEVLLFEALQEASSGELGCRCRERSFVGWCLVHGLCDCHYRTVRAVEGHPDWFEYVDPPPNADLECPIHRPQQELAL